MRADPVASQKCPFFQKGALIIPEILAGEPREMEHSPDTEYPHNFKSDLPAAGTGHVPDDVPGNNRIERARNEREQTGIGKDN
jgi:hypothetical protein